MIARSAMKIYNASRKRRPDNPGEAKQLLLNNNVIIDPDIIKLCLLNIIHINLTPAMCGAEPQAEHPNNGLVRGRH